MFKSSWSKPFLKPGKKCMKKRMLAMIFEISNFILCLFMRVSESIFSCLFYFSCPAFLDITGPLFRSSYSKLSKGVEEPQNWTSNVQNRDSKSKRDTKNSILVSISGNMAEKFSDSLCSSEKHFGLYFQKTRPETYYFYPD